MSFLGEYELEHLIKIKYEKIKRQFIWGRVAAKYALESIDSNIIFNDINIIKGSFNEPIIREIKNETLKVSILHSKNVAIAVAYPKEISCGIDIEYISEKSKKLTNKLITNEEMKLLSSIVEYKTLMGIYLWTIKEAISKSVIKGLSLPISTYAINKFYKCNNVYYGNYRNFKDYRYICKKYKKYIISISSNCKMTFFNQEKIKI